ncbi:MAG: hypothetical protein ACK5X3_09175, partial [Pseudomonadota bacterium]
LRRTEWESRSMGNKETAEREFAQALVKELQELHTRNYLREIGIVPTQVVFAALHTIKELLRQVAVLETEAALREPAPQPQAEPVGEWVMVPREPTHAMLKAGVEWGGEAMDYHEAMGRIGAAWGPMLAAAPQPQASAEDVELVGRYVTAHKSLKTDLHDAWQRIRASLGVGQ